MGPMRLSLAVLAVAILASGCSSTTTFKSPGVDFAGYKKLWVEQNLADDQGVNEMITGELRALGYDVGTGPATMMPRGIEAIITYTDQWTWDFKTYLIDVEVIVREPRSPRVVARGRYFRPGITAKAPGAMVRDVVQSIFPKARA